MDRSKKENNRTTNTYYKSVSSLIASSTSYRFDKENNCCYITYVIYDSLHRLCLGVKLQSLELLIRLDYLRKECSKSRLCPLKQLLPPDSNIQQSKSIVRK